MVFPVNRISLGSVLTRTLTGPLLNRVRNILPPESERYSPRALPGWYEPSPERLFLPNHNPGIVDKREYAKFIAGHPFEKQVGRAINEFVTVSEMVDIVQQTNFDISFYPSGAMPASTNDVSSYATHAWTRDMANKAYAMISLGCIDEAKTVIQALAEFYNIPDNRNQILKYHNTSKDYGISAKEAYRTRALGDLPIRAAINDEGKMELSSQPWGHNQLDAIGAWLAVTFKLANIIGDSKSEYYDPDFLNRMDAHLSGLNEENKKDSIFAAAFKMLNRIECWDNVDLGAWEDIPAHRRASSVGICVTAAQEAKFYFNHQGWDKVNIYETGVFKGELDSIIANGWETLNDRIPDESFSFAKECDIFASDAALAFLLYPYNPGFSEKQVLSIKRPLYRDRITPTGMTRRDQDDYLGQDYPYNIQGSGIYSNQFVPNYKAAGWTIFDSPLASYSFKKFNDNLEVHGFLDQESFMEGQFHLKRAISQLTKRPDAYVKRHYIHGSRPESCVNQELIRVREMVLPEAYWYDSHHVDQNTLEQGAWRPNENSPLLWSEANFLDMMGHAIRATNHWERVKLNGRYFETFMRGPISSQMISL